MDTQMAFYVNLVSFLKKTLSSAYEVILFDTTTEDCPVVAMSARNRDNEMAARQFVKDFLKDACSSGRSMVTNQSLQADTVKLIRTSCLFIPGPDGDIIGALCLLMQCNPYLKLQEILCSVLQFDLEDPEAPPSQPEVLWPQEPTLDIIEKMAAEFGPEPARFTVDERMEYICDLYDTDVFRLKGAVARTAQILQMSEQSVYRYLSKIKKARGL